MPIKRVNWDDRVVLTNEIPGMQAEVKAKGVRLKWFGSPNPYKGHAPADVRAWIKALNQLMDEALLVQAELKK